MQCNQIRISSRSCESIQNVPTHADVDADANAHVIIVIRPVSSPSQLALLKKSHASFLVSCSDPPQYSSHRYHAVSETVAIISRCVFPQGYALVMNKPAMLMVVVGVLMRNEDLMTSSSVLFC